MEIPKSDIIVIGAGASGSIASKHLAEAGLKVTCFEQGPEVHKDEYYGDQLEWEFMAHKRWHPNPNIRHNRNESDQHDSGGFCWQCHKPLHARTDRCPFCGETQ